MTMATSEAGFVSVSNLVSEVLMNIGDQEEKKYYARSLQNVLNKIRNVNVHYARQYEEIPVELDADLRYGDYPRDLVKAVSVGIYHNGEWWSFTRKPNMAKTLTGDGITADDDIGEGEEIPTHGVKFAARGFNEGYWVEDDANGRFFVRNYDKDKVILRYRSNGMKCTTETCIPYKLKDLIVAMVMVDFASNGLPRRFTGAEMQLKLSERARHYDELTDLEYIPQNMDEFMDAQYASSNLTVKRSL